jgi:hypothetical protein
LTMMTDGGGTSSTPYCRFAGLRGMSVVEVELHDAGVAAP